MCTVVGVNRIFGIWTIGFRVRRVRISVHKTETKYSVTGNGSANIDEPGPILFCKFKFVSFISHLINSYNSLCYSINDTVDKDYSESS